MYCKRLIIITFFLLSAFINSRAEQKNHIFEYCTGTWCGFCPCGHIIVDSLLKLYPNLIPVAYHGPENGSDPLSYYNGNQILNQIPFMSYPSATIDRTGEPVSYPLWFNLTHQQDSASSYSRVKLEVISKNYNISNRMLYFQIKSTALFNLNGNYKINALITENNVIAPQANYETCTTGVFNNYSHNNVVRDMFNGSLGETLISGNWNQNQSVTKDFSVVINNSWNADNCRFVVFVYRDSSVLFSAYIEQGLMQGVTSPIGIEEENTPAVYSLEQNYPNPFNPVTNIKFSVPVNNKISLVVYDQLGQIVRTLFDGYLSAGNYNIQFDASGLATGVYYYYLHSSGFNSVKSLVLIK